MTREQVLALLRRECARAGSQAKWARAHGLSPSYVADVLSGTRDLVPGRLLEALGVERVVGYRRVRRDEMTQRQAYRPVATVEDLETLNQDEIVEGYLGWRSGDPEPGPNRGRAYWHGWMNRARDNRERPHTPESEQLGREIVQRGKR